MATADAARQRMRDYEQLLLLPGQADGQRALAGPALEKLFPPALLAELQIADYKKLSSSKQSSMAEASSVSAGPFKISSSSAA